MAYYLQFTAGGNNHVNIPSYTIPVGGFMEIDLLKQDTSRTYIVGTASAFFDSSIRLDTGGVKRIVFCVGGTCYTSDVGAGSYPIATRFILRVERSATGYTVLADGVDMFLGEIPETVDFTFDQIGITNTTAEEFDGELYGLVLGSDRNYDPSASNGTGSTLPDTVGTNDGTLVNFPTDDSQWVFYSAGGATYTLALDPGSYTYTGSAVNLAANRVISLDAGSYNYTGQDLSLAANRSLSLDAGSYSYTGQNVTIKASRVISIDPGAYTYTGNDVTLTYTPTGGATYTLALDAGSYSLSGQGVALAANRALSLDAGSYSLSGQNVQLAAHRAISIDAGAFVVSGNAVALSAGRSITLEAGSYSYTGFPVALTYSGEVIALISGYSVNYKQDDITAGYGDDFTSAGFADDYIQARFL